MIIGKKIIKNFFHAIRVDIIYGLAWIYVKIFRTFNENKYLCISMLGRNYGDNIKYLAEYIGRHDQKAKIVWGFHKSVFQQTDCPFPKFQFYTFRYYVEMLTAKYILSNQRLTRWVLRKRKGQVYLQTWHGTALKRIGKDIQTKKRRSLWKRLTEPGVLDHDVKMTDIMVSGSRFMTNIYRNKFGFTGPIEETGTPRNDLFFGTHPEVVKKVYDYYHIPSDKLIVLYAPTFRYDRQFTYYDIDAAGILKEWERHTGKACVLMVRLHPNMLDKADKIEALFPAGTINASRYQDMQELLYAAGLLVTDYSSSMFDIMYQYTPVLLYTPDREKYGHNRGFYWDIDKLPFMVANQNTEIAQAIQAFNQEDYKQGVDDFLTEIGSVETGHACEKALAILKATKTK